MSKLIPLAFFLIAGLKGYSQPDSVYIGIDGLTCSMCSYSVESMIKKLPGVKSVRTDLNRNEATVTFIEGWAPDLTSLAERVYDAGFSVRFVRIFLLTENVEWYSNSLKSGPYEFVILKGRAPDKQVLQLDLDPMHFMPKRQYKKHIRKHGTDLQPQAKEGLTYYVIIY